MIPPPPPPPPPTHTHTPPHDYPYYWVILVPKSKEDKVKVRNLKNSPSPVAWWDVQIWNGSDKYCCRYRADTILSTDGQTDKVKPVYPFQLCWSGRYKKGVLTSSTQQRSTWVQYFRTKTLQVRSDSTENKLNPIPVSTALTKYSLYWTSLIKKYLFIRNNVRKLNYNLKTITQLFEG